MLSVGFTEGSGKFSGLLCAPRYYRHESLLDTSIHLTIGYHKREPLLFHDGGETFPYTGSKGYGFPGSLGASFMDEVDYPIFLGV